MIFIDTNIFMYAAGAEHPYKAPCVRIASDVETGNLEAATNTEVLQELLYRYSHIKLADKGVQLCREALLLPLTVLSVTEHNIQLALGVFDTHRAEGLKPCDAIHVATMQNNSMSRLISADAHFDLIPCIVRVDPQTYV